MHAFTLPVEFDASFRRALPVLKAGNYVGDKDMPAARKSCARRPSPMSRRRP